MVTGLSKPVGAQGKQTMFTVEIAIQGENDPNMLNNISTVLSKDLKISLHSINLDNEDGMFKGRLKISIRDTAHLDMLISRLSAIKGVYQVKGWRAAGSEGLYSVFGIRYSVCGIRSFGYICNLSSSIRHLIQFYIIFASHFLNQKNRKYEAS